MITGIKKRLSTIRELLQRFQYLLERPSLDRLFQRYKVCIVRIISELPSGESMIGTGFHIGDGYLVTARHIVDGVQIREIVGGHANQHVSVERIYYPEDSRVDLVVLKTDFSLEYYMTKVTILNGDKEREKTDHITIGGHLDEWIGDESILSKVLLMGFPPIPFSISPNIVAIEAEINTVIDKRKGPHPYFIISSIPRGGFSGSPVISEYGFLVGILTESLYEKEKPYELGFAAAISIEPLLILLHENGIEPGNNAYLLKEIFGENINSNQDKQSL